MGYYREQIEKARAAGIRGWELICAMEVDACVSGLTEEQFEAMSGFVYEWVMSTDAGPDEVMRIISGGIQSGDIKPEHFCGSEHIDGITEYINSMF